MKIRRKADGLLYDAHLQPGVRQAALDEDPDLDPDFATALAKDTIFCRSTEDVSWRDPERGTKMNTFEVCMSIDRGREQEWKLVYASEDERRQVREAGYEFE